MHRCRLALLIGLLLSRLLSQAGGSGANVLVVVNQDSTNSLELGNYYCEKRGIPPQNLIRVSWTGGNTTWTYSDYTNVVLNPVLNAIAIRGLTNQIAYVVLSMDFPFQVTQDGGSGAAGINSSTSPLFYGFKPDEPAPPFPGAPASCFLPYASSNSYSASEQPFQFTKPATAPTNSFLCTMLSSTSLAAAKALVDRGVLSDYSFPAEPVLLAHGTDPFRNVRYWTFDDAIFNTRLRAGYSMAETNLEVPSWFVNLLGFETGLHTLSANSNNFVPGAIGDSLTSYAGIIFGRTTKPVSWPLLMAAPPPVTEPSLALQLPREISFPASLFLSVTRLHNRRKLLPKRHESLSGFDGGRAPGQPVAKPPLVTWSTLTNGAILSGTTNLSLSVSSAAANLPVSQVDLFIDGAFHKTVTNIVPTAGNVLTVSVAGVSTNYVVPTNATISSVASNLATVFSGIAFSNGTGIRAFAHGDRIELKSAVPARLGTETPLAVSNSLGTASGLATYLSSSGTNFMDSPARGRRAYYLTNPPALGDYLQCFVIKTNGQVISVAVTNTSGSATLAQFAKTFFSAINTNAALQGPDGIAIEDIVMHEDFSYAFGTGDYAGDYNVRARGTGWPASQVKVSITGSPGFTFIPTGTNALGDNVEDLQPRAHLYVSAGVTNLTLPFTLNTTNLPDGFHELTAIAYEGTHVRTQARSARKVRIQNTPLTATLITLYGGSNTAVAATLQFQVTANTNVSKIELFSTGGLVASSTSQSNSVFSVGGPSLGAGLHPFYAVVTTSDGKTFRTDTTWIRLVADTAPFQLRITAPPPLLSWPAIVGRAYEIYSTTNLAQPFQLRATVTPSNSTGQWLEPNAGPAAFYRVQALD